MIDRERENMFTLAAIIVGATMFIVGSIAIGWGIGKMLEVW